MNSALNKIFIFSGVAEWVERVCNKNNLDERVQVLLEALPCPQHKVCQILSPNVLRNLARPPDQCRQEARDLWKNLFHKLFWMIRDFSDVFQQKLDLGQYNFLNDEENIQRCKVGNNLKTSDGSGNTRILGFFGFWKFSSIGK